MLELEAIMSEQATEQQQETLFDSPTLLLVHQKNRCMKGKCDALGLLLKVFAECSST